MNIPPLCIIQARYGSTRLPGKMLLKIGGESLIARAWRIACEAFGEANVVVAIPECDLESALHAELRRINANVRTAIGVASDDVLGRFYEVAHSMRWHPDSVIVRYTPDDWRKNVAALRRVAGGTREPVEIGGEAFTLAQLDAAHERERATRPISGDCSLVRGDDGTATGCRCGRPVSWTGYDGTAEHFNTRREHITYALFHCPAPEPPDDGLPWSIDTEADLIAARKSEGE